MRAAAFVPELIRQDGGARTVKQAQPVALEKQPLLSSLMLDFSRAEVLSSLSLNSHQRLHQDSERTRPKSFERAFEGFRSPGR
jgi:hypothetical protein